jgi:hypothetical protein
VGYCTKKKQYSTVSRRPAGKVLEKTKPGTEGNRCASFDSWIMLDNGLPRLLLVTPGEVSDRLLSFSKVGTSSFEDSRP